MVWWLKSWYIKHRCRLLTNRDTHNWVQFSFPPSSEETMSQLCAKFCNATPSLLLVVGAGSFIQECKSMSSELISVHLFNIHSVIADCCSKLICVVGCLCPFIFCTHTQVLFVYLLCLLFCLFVYYVARVVGCLCPFIFGTHTQVVFVYLLCLLFCLFFVYHVARVVGCLCPFIFSTHTQVLFVLTESLLLLEGPNFFL